MENQLIGAAITLAVLGISAAIKHYFTVKRWQNNRIELMDIKMEAMVTALSKLPNNWGKIFEDHYRARYQELVSESQFIDSNEVQR